MDFDKKLTHFKANISNTLHIHVSMIHERYIYIYMSATELMQLFTCHSNNRYFQFLFHTGE